MKSSSLPPSMARRERIKSACTHLQSTFKDCNKNIENKNISQMSNNNSISLERCKSMMPLLPIRGNNLAAILRCQVSRYYKIIQNFNKHLFLKLLYCNERNLQSFIYKIFIFTEKN